MLADYFFLALNNLRKRGLRSWLTMLGIFIGIAAVVSLISLGQGLEQAILGQFSSLDPDKLIVENVQAGFGPPGSTAVRKLTEHDAEIIGSVEGVDEVIPRLIRMVSVEYNKIRLFKSVASMPEDSGQVEIVYDSINAEAAEGRLLNAGDRGKVVLGNSYLDTEDFDKKINLGTRLVIQGEEFEVIGFLEKSGTFIINDALLMAEEDIEKILGIRNEIDMIVVQIKDEDEIESAAKDIERVLRRDRGQKLGEEDFSVQTPLQSLSAVSTILTIINLTITGIAAISLLVGGIGIANTMFASVLERRKEIGIMKSIGAKNRDVLTIFVLESGMLGLAGGVIGAIIGLGLALLVSSSASSFMGIDLRVSLSWPLILGAIAFSLILGLLSGLMPAIQAGRLNPVEALRK